MLEQLGFDQARYFGVDFSPAMLSNFREAHPETHLEAADVRSYVPAEPVDLIYSSQLLQYLSLTDIDRHLGSARNSLNPGGQIVHTSVLWNLMRWPYFSWMRKGAQQGLIRFASSLAVPRPPLGYWHTFYGSLFYPFRFHARMVPCAG